MNRWFLSLCLMLAALMPLRALAAERVALEHTTASLVSEYSQIDGQIAGKSPFWVLFRLDIQEGWHTYWINPGDSGLAPSLEWDLPEGVQAGEIVWQPPHRQPFGPLMNYGYSDVAYHLVQITPPKEGLKGSLPLKVSASWLVCEEECIPEEAELSLTVPVGEVSVASAQSEDIKRLVQTASLEALPITELTSDETSLTLRLPYQGARPQDLYIYPREAGVIETVAAQPFDLKDNVLTVRLTRGMLEVPDAFEGLLEVRDADGLRHYVITAPDVSPVSASADVGTGFWLILLSAFAGGIILNAMPCVFPVLSLKALAISRKAGQGDAHIRRDGLAYTAGVVISFLLIGGLFLLIRVGGDAVGWGFHMQSPLVVTALIYLLFVIGLNLSGLYDITLSFGGGQSLTQTDGWSGSFATGALATLVATPCTAPFMATALGAALTLPAIGALGVFAALGLGLAFPFLLLSVFPALLRKLPKPGPWMETFRQFLAFPMYLAAVWLLWVLGQQGGINAAALVLTGLVVFTLAVWVWRRVSGGKVRVVMAVLIALVSLFPFVILARGGEAQVENTGTAFSTDRIEQARASGEGVFVYGTAAWCITCKVNERVALDTAEVEAFMAERNITVIRADWTNADPAITDWLAQFGRNGVPLYVYYPPSGEPVVLPQVLTPAIVREKLS
ncbi:protein-disulfide reductase DsbD family protein [Asticcacaulis tiandongensis]|uniref:protein-disulfide reductase DsbD family protein n=1 Tax=Asticcacaulis tiandongensis TaxID=2565365 RepID=UPI001126B802|nr:protein-disulfide reductase DsbD domain-containing protein [Asticcacaulis tiandongensis]